MAVVPSGTAAINHTGENGNGTASEAAVAPAIAPAGGTRIGGRIYREGQQLPSRYARQRERGETQRDPSTRIEGAPPNFGRFPIPHVLTFSGLATSIARAYRNPDEAIKQSRQNAIAMRKDCAIMECLEARQRGTALLNWHIEPDDPKSHEQKELAQEVTKLLRMTPRFTEYRRNLLEALWYGKYGIEHSYHNDYRTRRRRVIVGDWLPIHGDKITYRFDDGTGRYDPKQVGIRMLGAYRLDDVMVGDRIVEPTDAGLAYFLEPWERRLMAIHKHMIEDAAYEDPTSSGSIHGVGIRSRIYWTWFQKQETLALLMEYIERTGLGIWIYWYPAGNDDARREVEKVANERTDSNTLIMPRMPGDPAMDAYGVERIEPNAAGAEVLKHICHEYFGHLMKRYILGQVLSTESEATGLGSGVADLHRESYQSIVHYDAANLEETITSDVVIPLKEFNFPAARNIHLRFKIDTESTEAEKKLNATRAGWEMGLKLRAEDVYDMIGVSKPGDDDEVLVNPAMLQQQRSWERQHGMGPGGAGGGFGDEGIDGHPAQGIGAEFEDDGDGAGDGTGENGRAGVNGAGFRNADLSNMSLADLFGPLVDEQPARDSQRSYRRARGGDGATLDQYKSARAPRGGVTVAGKFFVGGQFIPAETMAQATPEELAAIEAGDDGGKGSDAKGIADAMAAADTSHTGAGRDAPQSQSQSQQSPQQQQQQQPKQKPDQPRRPAGQNPRHEAVEREMPNVRNRSVRGLMRAMQQSEEYADTGTAYASRVAPEQAQAAYDWMAQALASDKHGRTPDGGRVVDLGNNRLGYSSAAGALVVQKPGMEGRAWQASYTTHTVPVSMAAGLSHEGPERKPMPGGADGQLGDEPRDGPRDDGPRDEDIEGGGAVPESAPKPPIPTPAQTAAAAAPATAAVGVGAVAATSPAPIAPPANEPVAPPHTEAANPTGAASVGEVPPESAANAVESTAAHPPVEPPPVPSMDQPIEQPIDQSGATAAVGTEAATPPGIAATSESTATADPGAGVGGDGATADIPADAPIESPAGKPRPFEDRIVEAHGRTSRALQAEHRPAQRPAAPDATEPPQSPVAPPSGATPTIPAPAASPATATAQPGSKRIRRGAAETIKSETAKSLELAGLSSSPANVAAIHEAIDSQQIKSRKDLQRLLARARAIHERGDLNADDAESLKKALQQRHNRSEGRKGAAGSLKAELRRAAEETGYDEKDIRDAVDYLHEMNAEAQSEREMAKEAARIATGMKASDISKLENSGLDYASGPSKHPKLRNFEDIARTLASEFPAIFGGTGYEGGGGRDTADYAAALWSLLREGPQAPTPKHQLVQQAVDYLTSQGYREYKEMAAAGLSGGGFDGPVPFARWKAERERRRYQGVAGMLRRLWRYLKSDQWPQSKSEIAKRLAKMADKASKETDSNPTDAQREAGNYRKGKLRLHGLEIAIETPRGAIRSGTDRNGKFWSIKMPWHYGYILKTESEADGDHVDVFLGPNLASDTVFVVDQNAPDGRFDEHKVLIGWDSMPEAKAAYLSAYSDDWSGFRNITGMSIDRFKRLIEEFDFKTPLAKG